MAFSRDRLGCDSSFVLGRIARDLKPCFDDTFNSPLPDDIQRLVNQLQGDAASHGDDTHDRDGSDENAESV